MDKILEKLAGVLSAEDLQEIKESFESAVDACQSYRGQKHSNQSGLEETQILSEQGAIRIVGLEREDLSKSR